MSPPGAWWRLLTLPILAALAAGISVYASGGPVLRSVVIAVTTGVVTWLVVRALTVQDDPWPAEPELAYEHGRVSQPWEISGFESALQRPEYLGRRAIRAVREVAVPVLLRRSIDLDEPADAKAARNLLGSRSFELLTNPEHGAVSRAELVALVDTVISLATIAGDGLRPVRIDPRLLPVRGRRSLRRLFGERVSARSRARTPPADDARSPADSEHSTGTVPPPDTASDSQLHNPEEPR